MPVFEKKSIKGFSRGFSMVEILFTIIALGVLLAPVSSIFSQGSSGTIRSRNDILAQQHAANLLAYAVSLPYEHEFLEPGPAKEVGDLQVMAGDTELSLGMDNEPFYRTIEVSEVKPADWQFCYKVAVVKISWKHAGDKTFSIQMAGLITP